jgi:hypothetical protein
LGGDFIDPSRVYYLANFTLYQKKKESLMRMEQQFYEYIEEN